ncbi:putative RNA methyltransferase [Lactococcus nasutitermitis]|uniref:RNA methyltransferase n=1 Tax=Lactococcus nasutitermitis TaxID=1652957 RepID=A0ABV9JC46_9LACT|nr:methyltransferase domain-containing protein [Lactococcus nasutitermitis]
MFPEILKCPVCASQLTKQDRHYECVDHHTFDLAREGYLNLILNAKKTAGDAKEMMRARQQFLNAGYYEPLSDHINQLLTVIFDSSVKNNIVDVGCGEGYYLSRFQQLTELSKMSNVDFYGMDISKVGIKMAAKRNANIHWLVANFAQLPFFDKSVKTILSMFAEYHISEFSRILQENGKIIIVRAGKHHLTELKEIIYPEIHEKSAQAIDNEKFKTFSIQKAPLTYKTTINNSADIQHLLLMTPHYWKIKPDSLERLKNYKQLEITVDIDIDILSN